MAGGRDYKMKKFLNLWIVLLISSISCNAQNSKTELEKYYKDNLLTLDPLEGIFDAEVIKQGENAFQVFPAEKHRFKLSVKKNYKGELVLSDYETGDAFFWKIERIGDTNVYNITHTWDNVGPTTHRVYLTNKIQFNHDFDIPQEQMRKDLGRNYRADFRVHYKWNFIKIYPTSSMYAEAERKKAEEQNEPSVRSGTGFALQEGYIVTNYHVVEKAKSIKVQGVKGVFSDIYNAKIIATDRVNDLAILKLDGNVQTEGLPYSVKTFTSDVGEDVWVLGYPLTSTMGDEIKLTTGVISAKSGYEGDVAMYQISAPIQPGNSGGPVFDSKGNLIGIVCAHHKGAENVNYAIKTAYLRNLNESSLSHDVLPHTNKLSTLSLASKVKAVKNFVYYITCSK